MMSATFAATTNAANIVSVASALLGLLPPGFGNQNQNSIERSPTNE